MKELAGTPKPGSSVRSLTRTVTPNTMFEELAGPGIPILKISLAHRGEIKLRATLSAAKPEPEP
jgi:uncharacterized membrane protein